MGFSRLNNCSYTEIHSTSGSLSYTNTLTAGSFLIVVISTAAGPQGTIAVSGTQNGSFGSPIVYLWSTVNGQDLGIWAIPNTKGAVSETINVTITGTTEFGILIEEFTGVATSSYVDGTGAIQETGYKTGATLSSGTFSTSVNGDLIYAAEISIDGSGNTSGLAVGSGFTIGGVNPLSTKPFGWFSDEYYTQATASGSTAGTYAQTGGSTDWIVACVAFKAASASANWLTEQYWYNNPYQQ
ncbi:MAG: hypothetical protein ACLQVJ_19220 [Syntrophobacteraceae bacterium]